MGQRTFYIQRCRGEYRSYVRRAADGVLEEILFVWLGIWGWSWYQVKICHTFGASPFGESTFSAIKRWQVSLSLPKTISMRSVGAEMCQEKLQRKACCVYG